MARIKTRSRKKILSSNSVSWKPKHLWVKLYSHHHHNRHKHPGCHMSRVALLLILGMLLSGIIRSVGSMFDGRHIEELGLTLGGLIIAICLAGSVVETWENTNNAVIESSLLSCHTTTLPFSVTWKTFGVITGLMITIFAVIRKCSTVLILLSGNSEMKAAVVCHGMDRALCKSVLYNISSSKCHIFSYSLKGRFTVSPTLTGLTYMETLCDPDEYDDDDFEVMTKSGHCNSQSTHLQTVPIEKDCQAHHDAGIRVDGIYTLYNDDGTEFDAWCEFDTNNGWTVIQRRQDGSQHFNLLWADYKQGFGDLNNEYWLGNDYIHELTRRHDQRLRITLTAVDGDDVSTEYASFYIGDEEEQYSLHICGFNGQHGDVMGVYNTMEFSTPDVDNDHHPDLDCATAYTGGWWFYACSDGNLNGLYGQGQIDKGITWFLYRNRWDDNFANTVMKISRG